MPGVQSQEQINIVTSVLLAMLKDITKNKVEYVNGRVYYAFDHGVFI